jgi:hypothetical protein
MKQLMFTIIVLASLWLNLTAMEHQKLFPNVKKINCGLYVGKVADGFYLAMKRIDQNNIDDWLQYALFQGSAYSHIPLKKYLPDSSGIGHFRQVLSSYEQSEIIHNNELWVAYASNKPITKGDKPRNSFIEMFLTVVTSPKALITSHMGISRTWEAAYDLQQNPPKRKKHPYQSVHLHSFAAKVMKLIDPKKVYMLTAPTPLMSKILLMKMPTGSVFIGDNFYQKKLNEIKKDPKKLLTEWDLKVIEKETVQDRDERLKEAVDFLYKDYKCKEKFSLLKTNPPRIIRTNNQGFIIQNSNGKTLVTFDRDVSTYQWMFTAAYKDSGLTLPYVLVDLDELSKIFTLIK